MQGNELDELFESEPSSTEKYYIRFDTEKNALDSLRRAVEFMVKAESEPDHWKWFVIALHSALYGYSISAIRGTDSDRVKSGGGRLIGFPEAIKRCKSADWTSQYGRPLTWNSERESSVRAITETLRNGFEHFRALSWSIEKLYIVNHSLQYVGIIDELAANATPLSPMRMHGNIELTRLLCRTASTFLFGYVDLLNASIQRDEEAARAQKFRQVP